jgi:hypothetical protein
MGSEDAGAESCHAHTDQNQTHQPKMNDDRLVRAKDDYQRRHVAGAIAADGCGVAQRCEPVEDKCHRPGCRTHRERYSAKSAEARLAAPSQRQTNADAAECPAERSDKDGRMNPFPCAVLHNFADEVTKVFVTPDRPKTRIGWRMLDAAPEKDRSAKQQESARNRVEKAFGGSHRAVPRFASALDDSTVNASA